MKKYIRLNWNRGSQNGCEDQLCLLKTSINEPNANESAEDAKVIELLKQQNKKLVEKIPQKHHT